MSNGKAKAEEEDLDDLDDVLEQFTSPQLPPPPKSVPLPPSSSSAPPVLPKTTTTTQDPDDILSDDFTKHLATEMEAMMRELSVEDPSAPSEPADGSFQSKVRQAMEKLHESDQTLKAGGADSDTTLEGLLATLGGLSSPNESPEDLESMLENMMSQLMSKDILYEPLKELDTKYPEYLAKNSSTLSSEDLSRYTDQRARVSQIVAVFENPSYAEDDPAHTAEVLRLMNEMQSYGAPPAELMGTLPAGFELGPDGLPNNPEGCIIA